MYLKKILKKVTLACLILSLVANAGLSMVNAAVSQEKIQKQEANELEIEKGQKSDVETGNEESKVDTVIKQEEENKVDVETDVNHDEDKAIETVEYEKQTMEVFAVSPASELLDEEETENEPQLVKAEFNDETETLYVMEITNCEVPQNHILRAAVWSDKDGQDDLKWNNLVKIDENTFQLVVPISEYKSSGDFLVHIYEFEENEPLSYILGTKFNVAEITKGDVEVIAQEYKNGTAQIEINGVSAPSGITHVRTAVWSDTKQQDIYWYDAVKDGDKWIVNMNITNHKNNWSEYAVHTYATDGNGFQQFVGGTQIDFSLVEQLPEISLDEKLGNVNIKFSEVNAPGKIKSIRCAIWSDANGQDDLVWYNMKELFGTWQVKTPMKNLRSHGTCKIHAYASKEDGTMIFLGGDTFVLEGPSTENVEVLSDEDGTFSIKADNVVAPTGIEKVEVAVWSDEAGQDDLIWYTAEKTSNNVYEVVSDISKHKYDINSYSIHVYAEDGLGIKSAIGCVSMNFESKIGEVTVKEKQKETLYEVIIPVELYPMGLKEVKFAVWSVNGGQDDICWYDATVDGINYRANIDIKKHKTSGKYFIDTYGITKGNKLVYLGGNSEIEIIGTATGKVEVTDRTDSSGSFEVTVSDVKAPTGVDSVRFAAWPASNSSAVAWYTCKNNSDGKYSAEVKISNHQYGVGEYVIHVYTVMGNQVQSYTTGLRYKFEPENYLYVLDKQERGKRTIVYRNPSLESNIRFAVWSDSNGQDDCVWYKATKAADGTWRATVNSNNHKDGGTFSVHAYSDSTPISAISFEIPKKEFYKNGWFYEKINGRTYKLYYVNDVLQKDVRNIIGNVGSYKAEVNRVTCTVTIYAQDGANGYIIPVVTFACSVGLPKTPTPLGTYGTLEKYRWAELMGPSWGQYCTRIVGGILFHSVAGSNMTSYNLSAAAYNQLGSPASHGCVRLCVRDAKWIYDYCPLGMAVTIYDSSYPGPFGKPATIKIPASQNWDPTDPNI